MKGADELCTLLCATVRDRIISPSTYTAIVPVPASNTPAT
jgi:hypothetical protein